jgi:diphosphomevalonate decarboxylase
MDQIYHKVKVQAPSNIAFIKYWGKFGRQYPLNPSLSMTLNKCLTEMEIEYTLDSHSKKITDFIFENKKNEKFKKRIEQYLHDIEDIFPLAKRLSLKIKSSNTFPHSAGIASSASAMAAVAAGLCAIKTQITGEEPSLDEMSGLARLGSGSACRSLFPSFSIWGESDHVMGNNNFAVKYTKFHSNFSKLQDTILIVSGKEKAISSSIGHELMHGHSFRDARCRQAKENLVTILSAMENGDYKTFGEILENEALTLHALMMTSYPSYILLKPESLELIERIRKARSELDIPMYFTIDAGPNIHLIYPDSHIELVHTFLDQEIKHLCENMIFDSIGMGYKILK